MNKASQFLVCGTLFATVHATAATFPVTSTNDNGAGTLRQAILDANASPGLDTIAFNIATAGLTISPTNALPPITDPVTLDGATQPGFSGAPIVELNGLSAGANVDGLRVWAGNSTIRGLVINRFTGDGIEIATNGNNAIERCYIGLDVTGTMDRGNTLSGIFITNAPNNRIGGTNSSERNVIAGNNQNGVLIQALGAAGNVILGNYIGLNATGGVAVANGVNGVFINGAPSNTVGGTSVGARNVISGNSQSGVRFEGTNTFASLVAGNFIGLDQNGFADVGNGQNGVLVINAPSNTVGGASAAARNVISGNNQIGVRLDGVSARGNRVFGNFIGTDASGQLARGNSLEGVGPQNNASFNSIGGTNVGEANLIAFNGGDGVFIANGTNNVVRANAIHSNGGLGIDLGADGKLANDAGDADSGANALQNYPVLAAATNTPGGLVVFGTLNSRPNAAYALDFYSSSLCDPSTNGEGQVYLGSLSVTTGSDSNTTFNVTLPAAVGRFITATATDTNGNTSEFSTCLAAQSTLPPATFSVVNTNDSGPGSLRRAIEDNNLAVTSARNTITFNIPGADPLVITPSSPLPVPTERVAIDGYTQPGASANTLSNGNNAVVRIRLDGASAGSGVDGLRLTNPGMLVRGLSVTRFASDGIEISTNGNQTIEGCWIGLDTDGTNALGNNAHGIHINGTAFNIIGGSAPAQRNLISGNGQNGVHVTGGNATNNFIAGNFVGTDRTGTLDRGNGGDGVNLNNAPRNAVGSVAAGDGNLISGNNNDGIDLNGASTTNNSVAGNWIGTDVSGTLALGNNQSGVAFNSNARFNTVGVNVAGGGNVMAFNGNIGVAAGGGTNNAINANRIFGNSALGIDLANNSVTANDAGDADTGPNQLQNFPVITSGTINPASVVLAGTLNSRASSGFTLDFFANLVCDASGNGEGQQFLGSTSVTTDGSGNAAFNVTLPAVPVGRYLTATATDTNGNTSEFSACFAAASTLPPATLTVVNTNDAGPGSLRQALLDAGNFPSSSPNLIAFNIPGVGPHTIMPLSQLPAPAEPVDLNGYTQPGASPNTLSNGFNAVIKIRLDFASIGGFGVDGLRLRAGRSIVRGLAILRLNNNEGIDIAGGDSNRITGCLVGIDVDGSDKHLNSTGILINSAGNEVGGLTPADRNVISYNWTHGVSIQGAAASNNLVRGNFVGTDLAGATNRGNLIAGVNITDAAFNVLGGVEPGARNIIGGNATGVTLTGGGSWSNRVQGNYIGSDVTGTLRLGDSTGVSLSSASSNLIGGATLAARNLIGGHRSSAVSIVGGGANIVQGNLIGPSVTGATNLLNVSGIVLSSATTGNLIGGTNSGEGNIIAYNSHTGVLVNDGERNAIRGNSIHGTEVRFGLTGLGIDLGFAGVTTNDPGDVDTGANQLQNFPVLTGASANPSGTTIQGSLNSAASQTFQLDFFANLVCDTSGNGEGQFYLGSASVVTDGGGNAGFNVTLPVSAPGRFITATATDAQGNTSEFSPCYEATLSTPPMTFTVTTTNDAGSGSLREAIIASNGHISSQNNTIQFNIPGSGVRVIRLASVLPAFIQPVSLDGFTQPGASANTLASGSDANWLVELRGVGATFNEKTLRLNLPGLIVRGLRLTGSAGVGIEMVTSNCVVVGCFISGNVAGGILISSAHRNRIGGATPAERNIISGHGGSRAIEILNGDANTILGNLVGPDPAGGNALGGQFDGVSIFNGSGNVIGDGTAAGGNVIAFHQSDAVSIQSGTNNSVRGNRIFSNSFPIDLGSDGVTANDPGDGDDGANHLQNFPILTNAIANTGSTVIQGRLNSRPNTAFTLEFFANTVCHFSGNGEGEFFLGSASVMTDGGGNIAFNVVLPVTADRDFITATATDPVGNTSEFSPCQQATVNLPPQTYFVTNTNDSGPGSLRQAMADSALVPNTGADRIHFNIPGAGPHRIHLLSFLPSFTEPLIIDGYTQPGAAPNTSSNRANAVLKIQIDGSFMGGGSALSITNSGNSVRGLSLTRFSDDVIVVSGPSNVVEGNWIGVDPSGAAGGNTSAGITIINSYNLVGGTNPAARNVIGANEDGILIAGPGASNNVIAGNFIGVAPDGTNAVGNLDDGVRIFSASWNLIGDPTYTAGGNVIAFNGEDGVSVDSGRQNAILLNRISRNGQKNIFVAPGANDGVQPPILAQAYTGSLTVKGKIVDGLPDTVYRIDVYYEDLRPILLLTIPETGPVGSFEVRTDVNGMSDYTHTFTDVGEAGQELNGDFVRTTTTCQNNTSEESAGVQIVPGSSADLKITMVPPTSPVNIGDTVTYVMTMMNNGPATANNVGFQAGQSPGLQILSATSPNGTCTIENGVVKCKVSSLAAGQTAQVTVTAKANAPGQMLTTASVSSDEVDPDEFNNGALHDVFVRSGPNPSELGVSLAIDGSSVRPGNQVTLTARHRNNGLNIANDVTLTHSVPPGTVLQSHNTTKGNCILIDGILTCDVDSLAIGEEVTVNLGVQVNTFGPQAAFEFGSTVWSAEGDPFLVNNVSSAAVALDVPLLRAVREAGQTKIFWAGPTVGLQLERATDLSGLQDALTVPDNQVTFENGNHVHRPAEGDRQAFFRLAAADLLATPFVEIYQQGLRVDVADVMFSELLRADVTFRKGVSVDYLNISVPCPEPAAPAPLGLRAAGQQNETNNVCWVVENVPLITNATTNRSTRVSVNFPLYSNSVPLHRLNYGLSITTNRLTVPPPVTNSGPVFPSMLTLRSGVSNRFTTWRPALPLAAGPIAGLFTAKPNFFSTEQGVNECAPGAVKDSLTYLKRNFPLRNLPLGEITMDKMKEATGWTPAGAPAGFLGIGEWSDLKDTYMQDRNFPIITTQTTDMTQVITALTNCCDVEIRVEGHVAAVVAIADIGNGDYALTLSHDIRQGAIGGVVREIVIFDSENGTVTGSAWGRDFVEFVIECPGP